MIYAIALAGLLTCCIALGLHAWLSHRRLQHLELLLLRNSQDVACFSDATLAIGRAMEELLKRPELGELPAASSRRLLIAQAQQRLAAGEPLAAVASRYHLSGDEQALLAQLRPAA
ncbi:MAG: hypothetical protein AAGG11_15485 [Pseudomonadota bacterium]